MPCDKVYWRRRGGGGSGTARVRRGGHLHHPNTPGPGVIRECNRGYMSVGGGGGGHLKP